MVEVVIDRDEEGRVQTVTLHSDESAEGLAAEALVEAPILGLRDYLHLDPEVSKEGRAVRFRVDRSDFFLDREIDAVIETMVLGLRFLASARPGRVTVHEVGEGIKV
ncbi:MAG: hypothetical protein BIP78_0807 [Candidatus Bipolaricaulis sibiricus]|uniref:Uncharacterized protein n=1 Tax=Bipolaricaulis sibiricus TaxID=2501609 RepID=A0A410FU78_BIPS1|nr:MAG: hypothetical protein BIP78_0807 [Candidatus Bipolaricaulis sibiricus]